jgi:hypothetical protein
MQRAGNPSIAVLVRSSEYVRSRRVRTVSTAKWITDWQMRQVVNGRPMFGAPAGDAVT